MRVGIVAVNNIRYSPYIFFYTEILKRIGVDYELIIANRYELEEHFDEPLHVVPWKKHSNPLFNYYYYSQNVKRIIKKQSYDAIIILTSINAVFLGVWLKHNYSKRYIVDIRDYSHENIYPYYAIEKMVIRHSALNVISSKRFTTFLPKADYHVCHNFDESIEEEYSFQHKDGQIIIGYVGGLSYVDQCTKLMKLVACDQRYRFEFYGTSNKEALLRKAADDLRCDRIIFHGGYAPEEKGDIISSVDILFNAYGSGSMLLDCALSNKLYDALIYKKPILTCRETYMTEMGGPLAFPIDLTDRKALDDLYKWYRKIDKKSIENYSKKMVQKMTEENIDTKKAIAECLIDIAGKQAR